MTHVVVFDYGFGNVRSMVRALRNIGLDVTLSADRELACNADGLVVPGVGASAACMQGLRDSGGDRIIRERLAAGKPVLGVCVGLQILCESGREHGIESQGLGLIGGSVDVLDADVVPHMGWNQIETDRNSVLFQGLAQERFYFVHSYGVSERSYTASVSLPLPATMQGQQERVTWCHYGRTRFIAGYERGPLSATQFHPEKSAQAGALLLRHWADTLVR